VREGWVKASARQPKIPYWWQQPSVLLDMPRPFGRRVPAGGFCVAGAQEVSAQDKETAVTQALLGEAEGEGVLLRKGWHKEWGVHWIVCA
jgi:hypothetical protein